MPHSNDRTLITAAGDAEVRVFDIERSSSGGQTLSGRDSDQGSASTRESRRADSRPSQRPHFEVQSLSQANTNARVYRSHADRVKRIVTESSPYIFLTCSEDGEVRQFDTRLPSSAYPAPRGGRGFLAHRPDHDASNVPPPLISYKRYNLDINSISCSASQPHYIALGGAHMHCFLHDRRMLGRDIPRERGSPGNVSPARSMSSLEDDGMGRATRCVRRFAPGGRSKGQRYENGHITACKISDANPNELIASWSGDHIYSFDLIRSPDASETRANSNVTLDSISRRKAKESTYRKRKRTRTTQSQHERSRTSSRRRRQDIDLAASDMALRVRYENALSEDIAMSVMASSVDLEAARELSLTDSQRRSTQIAKSLVKIRKLMFSLDASTHYAGQSPDSLQTDTFNAALGWAASILPEMDEIPRTWGYPINPRPEQVVLQSTLRANRDSSRRFVQAAGVLSRLLEGREQTAPPSFESAQELFRTIGPAPHEGPPQSAWEIFRYDFLRAIVLWLEGGRHALLEGFKRRPCQSNRNRYPVPSDASEDAIDAIIIPYLLQRAQHTDTPIISINASRFERDETRQIFSSESAAVLAFASAIRMPLEDLSRAVLPASESAIGSEQRPAIQDRHAAVKFWAFKVGRGLLMNAAEGVNFQFVDTAFGGLGQQAVEEDRSQEDIDSDEEDEQRICGITLRHATEGTDDESDDDNDDDSENSDLEETDPGDNIDGIDGDDDNDEDSDQDDDDEADSGDEERAFMFQSRSNRGNLKASVEKHVPCDSHTRTYRGHCNVKTVKDANFFGLNDEYVVSGSDSGHLFIWDRQTSELVNILEGDSDVVNVIQGKASNQQFLLRIPD